MEVQIDSGWIGYSLATFTSPVIYTIGQSEPIVVEVDPKDAQFIGYASSMAKWHQADPDTLSPHARVTLVDEKRRPLPAKVLSVVMDDPVKITLQVEENMIWIEEAKKRGYLEVD